MFNRPERANQVTSICMFPSLWAKVQKHAYESGKTQAEIVREGLTLYFAKLARKDHARKRTS